MTTTTGFTSADLEVLPADNKRYEIIEGDLFVSRTPHIYHQDVCVQVIGLLMTWNERAKLGRVLAAPGLVLAEDDDVVPDVAWASHELLARAVDSSGHRTEVPELIIEVLSPGSENQRRDRDAKLKLYSRRGAVEYWIVDWQARAVDIYRRDGEGLEQVEHVGDGALTSPNLPGFSGTLDALFSGLPS